MAAISLFDPVHHWANKLSTTHAWTFPVLFISFVLIIWRLYTKFYSSALAFKLNSKKAVNAKTAATASPLVQVKQGLGTEVANSYALEREITVPFDVGDVKVTKLLVHPIKSCRGTSVMESRYNLEGLENDRKWAVLQSDSRVVLTAREVPKMVLIEPRIEVDSASPYGGRLVVTFPEGSGCETFSVPLYPTEDLLQKWSTVDDCTMFGVFVLQGYICSSLDSAGRSPSEILSQYFERPVHLVMKGPRRRDCLPTLAFPDLKASAVFQDVYPFLIASEESLAEVGRVINAYAQDESPEAHIGGLNRERWRDTKVEIERFRPNIVIRGSGVPFGEDMWRRIRLRPANATEGSDGTRTFTLVSKCARCLLPNVDPKNGTRDAAVPYKVMLKFRKGKDPERKHKPCFGCNGVVETEGVVRVGDRIEVIEWASGIGV